MITDSGSSGLATTVSRVAIINFKSVSRYFEDLCSIDNIYGDFATIPWVGGGWRFTS